MKPKAPSPKKFSDQLEHAALQLILHAYDHHKTHARFQETQRAGFLLAYLGLAGIVTTSLFNKSADAEGLSWQGRQLFIAAYVFLLVVGIWTGIAMMKVGVEFRRHFHQAEQIVLGMQRLLPDDSAARELLGQARMGTSGDESSGFRRFLSTKFGVSSVHTYLISCVLAADVAIIALLTVGKWTSSAVIFVVCALLFMALLQAYRKLIYVSSLPS